MAPYSSGGVYVNYLGQEADEGAERVKSAYGSEKYARLVALKQKYGPTNLFRLNQNIRPTGVRIDRLDPWPDQKGDQWLCRRGDRVAARFFCTAYVGLWHSCDMP